MIHIQSQWTPLPVAPEVVERAADAALAHEHAAGDLTVVLAGDAQLQALNRQYLGIDAPTDVLAFPGTQPDPESGVMYLGDVLISLTQAEAQARAAGHSLESEVQLLVVHGVLHLLGHDHDEYGAKSSRFTAQGDVMRRLGLSEFVIREI
jgi:probable rRNA maturation factor